MDSTRTGRPGEGHGDTSEPGGKAPENGPAIDQQEPAVDPRLLPGGAHGAPTDPGITGIDRDRMPWRNERPNAVPER